MSGITKKVSIMCFHDELCQVYNALMTALSLLREGSRVTLFFGSRGINAVNRHKVGTLKCMPDEPKEVGKAVMKKMEEMELPTVEDLFFILMAEGATVFACPLNLSLFEMSREDLLDDVTPADPATYYKDIVIRSDMNLSF